MAFIESARNDKRLGTECVQVFLFKVLEMIFTLQLLSHLEVNGLLSKYKSDFLASCVTETLFVHLLSYLLLVH